MKNKYILILFFLCFSVISCNDFKEQKFKNLTNTDISQLLWIPSFLWENEEIKNQVFNIYECHDLDTNQSWGYFSITNLNLIIGNATLIDKYTCTNRERKRLKKIGCNFDFLKTFTKKGNQFSYNLLYDESSGIIYYYGYYNKSNTHK